MERLHSLFGFLALAFLAWLISENRKGICLRSVLAGLSIQIFFAMLLLKVPGSQSVFLWLNELVQALETSTRAGTAFVFGYLGGGPLPFEEKIHGSSYILAFRGLPIILVISAISSLLFYWNVIPIVVHSFAWVLRRAMGIGGVEGLGTAANIFVGMVEAPLLVRPYLRTVSRSGLFTIMTSGMATIAGTVMVLYASVLRDTVTGVMGHLLAASIISAPAAVTVSKLMVPETAESPAAVRTLPREAKSTMDAITRGTFDGVKLLINIVAMLVVVVSMVQFINLLLGLLPHYSEEALTLQRVMGYLFCPVTWLMGIPWSEAKISGSLMGIKIVFNEFMAYLEMAALAKETFDPRTRLIMTYAMCGFANLGSLGIMIGGMGAMAKERRGEIVELGSKAVIAGVLATCMTGAVVGIIF